ncbi:MAG: hypothetical protein MUF77_00145 [Leptospira sp.]|jgi:hypothetical protein|nr:hypothetical protein [Leptospira sp.]
MKSPNQTAKAKELAKKLFSEGIFPDESHLEEEPGVLDAFLEWEESFFAILRESAPTIDSETLDIRKAEITLQQNPLPLPVYLREYTKNNLSLPEKNDNLIVVLSEKGIRLVGSLLKTLSIQESSQLPLAFRSAQTDAPDDVTNSVIFQETTAEDQKFYYQIVKENKNEVYLSVKAEAEPIFQQVNLRRDGRFILTGKINHDGSASFSGLAPGNYTIEFIGNGISKSFDLSILVG